MSSLIVRCDTLKIPIIPVPVTAAPMYKLVCVELIVTDVKAYHGMYQRGVVYRPHIHYIDLVTFQLYLAGK